LAAAARVLVTTIMDERGIYGETKVGPDPCTTSTTPIPVHRGFSRLDRHYLAAGDPNAIAKETIVMTRGVVAGWVLVLGGMLVGGQPAAAAPALRADQSLRDEAIVQQIQYRYCRGWHRKCSYRWGYGWLYRRCMRRHGC